MKIRVLTMESEIGVPEITNADNGQNGTGAVWNFSAELPEGKASFDEIVGSKDVDISFVRPQPV